MRAVLNLPSRATYADYLAAEEHSERRHELIDGVIVAMAGGSDEHNAIAARFAALCGARVPRGCRCYAPAQRFWIAANGRARRCDASIIWGPSAHPAHDRLATTNPVVVVEVQSLSGQGDNDGDKRRDFQSLGPLQAYVLAAQDARTVRVYRRNQLGEWGAPPEVYGDGQRFELQGLTSAIAVAEIYDDILDAAGNSLLR